MLNKNVNMPGQDDEIFDVDDVKVVEAEEFVETVDYSDDDCFHMYVEDIFNIWGRGVTVVGVCRDGVVKVGQEVSVCAPDGTVVSATVAAIESFKKMLNEAVPGTIVGILLKGIKKNQVAKGYTLKGNK